MAFLLIEITEFRATERPQGRLAADLVRQFVAKALLSTTRGTDFVGRLGEDQFAVVLGECNDSQPAIARLLLALEDPTIPDADAPGGRRSISLIVHAGCVEVPVAAWCQGFGHLFHLAEERMRSVQTIRKSHAAKTVLGSSEHEGTAAG